MNPLPRAAGRSAAACETDSGVPGGRRPRRPRAGVSSPRSVQPAPRGRPWRELPEARATLLVPVSSVEKAEAVLRDEPPWSPAGTQTTPSHGPTRPLKVVVRAWRQAAREQTEVQAWDARAVHTHRTRSALGRAVEQNLPIATRASASCRGRRGWLRRRAAGPHRGDWRSPSVPRGSRLRQRRSVRTPRCGLAIPDSPAVSSLETSVTRCCVRHRSRCPVASLRAHPSGPLAPHAPPHPRRLAWRFTPYPVCGRRHTGSSVS